MEGTMRKPRVLFLCTGNSARSQMAEAFLRKHAGEAFEAYSAGMEPKGINPYTERVMEEIGMPLDGHRSKPLTEYMGKVHFGYLVTVCSEADKNCPSVFPGMGERLHWDLEDPAAFEGTEAETLAKFREVRDEIERRIKRWLSEVHVEAGA
jgi:arsenate reductase (thioredoxin)